MKVNYDPKYVTPHNHSLEARLNVTKGIYRAAQGDRRLKEALEYEAARRKHSQRWSSPPRPTLTQTKAGSAPEKSVKPAKGDRHHERKRSSEEESVDESPQHGGRGSQNKDRMDPASSVETSPRLGNNTSEKTNKARESNSDGSTKNQRPKNPNQVFERLFNPREQAVPEKENVPETGHEARHREGVAKAHATIRLQPLKAPKPEKAASAVNPQIHRSIKGRLH